MMIRINQLKLPLDYAKRPLKYYAAKTLRIAENEITAVRLAKRSVDARDKAKVHFTATIDVETSREIRMLPAGAVKLEKPEPRVLPAPRSLAHRPLVVGLGPAGLFAGLTLAKMGMRPVVVERGRPVEERAKDVERFWLTGALDPASNVQFGEGGAGAFSDGKLTTGIKDPRCSEVLETLYRAGAPEEILYAAKPHIGTDRLRDVVKNIRNEIIALGGDVHFGTQLIEIMVRDGNVVGAVCEGDNGRLNIDTEDIILAVGHFARDTFEMLHRMGVRMSQKPFSIGARIEHPQTLINRAQYGDFAAHPALGAADYKLALHLPSGRSVYTFCMCPGGSVVASASEEDSVVTNGMSCFARDERNANSALLVGVGPEDFGSDHPLAGMFLQRDIERRAFILGGSTGKAPAQLVGDLLAGRASTAPASVIPSYRPGVVMGDLSALLPETIIGAMREALPLLGRKLRGFDHPDAILTAPETRSSSPVRIPRGADLMSVDCAGLYPCGEGAGYAGGITSAAVDGVRCAEAVLAAIMPTARA